MTPVRLVVVGAGSAGQMAVSEMLKHSQSGLLPVAFVDDDPSKLAADFAGVPVKGKLEDLPEVISDTGADEILIALPSVHGDVIREIVQTCRRLQVRFRVVPPIMEIIRGDVHLEQIRQIEPEDLLGRQTVEPDLDLIADAYQGKRVLVTGAGGSIGRELSRQILDADPAALALVGRGENSLFETHVELSRLGTASAPVSLILADIKQKVGLCRAVEEFQPHTVLHAAAHKHVAFMERHPEEAVFNNILATHHLMDLCREFGAERFVMLSTDKAVDPQGVMGASKRVAELMIQHRAETKPTRFMAVRFGNVLGSRGSVVPLFKRQIASGGPVTVSHPEVSRFFMTVKEAAMLVLKAGAIGRGGEIFILDMGATIKILDLAKQLITLSGFRPEQDIAIEISGLQPGEKMHEALVNSFEELAPTSLPRVQIARRIKGSPVDVAPYLSRLRVAAEAADGEAIRSLLGEILPEADLPDSSGRGETG